MKIEGYDVVEVSPGVTVYERKNAPHTTYDTTYPWVHLHYMQTDDEADRLGFLEVELCCHGCGIALWVTIPFPVTDAITSRTKAIREEFLRNHAEHDTIYVEGDGFVLGAMVKMLKGHPMTQLCPDFRKQIFTLKVT